MSPPPATLTQSALLLDFQPFVLDSFVPPELAASCVERASALLASARAAKLTIIHVEVGFRPGFPEINPDHAISSWLRDSGLVEPGHPGTATAAAPAPLPMEPIVVKHRMGAFSHTDLEQILRARGIHRLILAGVTTSGVLLPTMRQAFDLDYDLIVAHDGCADTDADTQPC